MFISAEFWALLLAGVGLYWLARAQYRLPIIIILSLLVLLRLEPTGTAFLCLFIVSFYYTSSLPGRLVTPTLILGAGLYLFYYKYYPALASYLSQASPAEKLILPMGVSYFTFKLIHYAIERSRNTLAQHSIWEFSAYMLFFPIFSAGPIERFENFKRNLTPVWDSEHLIQGLNRIAHGLIKKFVLVYYLTQYINELGSTNGVLQGDTSTTSSWLIFIFSYLVMYLEFSAYSDLAIGCSRLFGIKILENFNWPILATNILDYWKRWHISLSRWCQSYIYMPTLALSRIPYVAGYTSFFIMGLWHAASWNWILWGIWHATAVASATRWAVFVRRHKLNYPRNWASRLIGWFATMLVVVLASVFTTLHGQADVLECFRIIAQLLLLI